MTAIEQRQFSRWAEDSVQSWLAGLDLCRLIHPSASPPAIPVIERFDWHGRPAEPGFRRIRVMGRQAYVLCHAALGGRADARRLAPIAVGALIERGIGADGQFYSRLRPDGSVLDAAADLYDIAFGLFALAWWYRLSGDDMAVRIAERSLANVQAAMANPTGRGFIARAGAMGGLEQNPHMHLFEAAIFLAAFTGRPAFKALADDLFDLAEQVLFDAHTGTLPELFDARGCPRSTEGAVRVEPGHQYEWVWLLHRYAHLADQPRAYAMADRLFAFAQRHGHDSMTGLTVAEVDPQGQRLATDLRIWPNTEFLKAQIAMQERHGPGPGFDDCAIMHNIRRIRDNFLTRQPQGPAAALSEGWWIDHLDGASLKPHCDHIPASSLYHIFFAFSELLRHRAGHDPFSGLPW